MLVLLLLIVLEILEVEAGVAVQALLSKRLAGSMIPIKEILC